WQRIERDEVQRRFGLRLAPGLFAVFQPEAGIVRADRALAAFARGIDVRFGTKISSLSDLDAGCVIVTAGAWVNELITPSLPVRVPREPVCYFRPADTRPLPAFVSFGREGSIVLYALRDPLYGIKAAAHHAGPRADPSAPGEPNQRLVETITGWVAEHV